MIQILLLMLMIIASVVDIKKKEIPVVLIGLCGVLAAASFIYGFVMGTVGIEEALSLVPGLAMTLISLATRGALGIGDGLMLICIGPVLGLDETCAGLLIALFLSCLFSVGILACKKGNRKSQIPFIPFLTAGMGVSLLCASFRVI